MGVETTQTSLRAFLKLSLAAAATGMLTSCGGCKVWAFQRKGPTPKPWRGEAQHVASQGSAKVQRPSRGKSTGSFQPPAPAPPPPDNDTDISQLLPLAVPAGQRLEPVGQHSRIRTPERATPR